MSPLKPARNCPGTGSRYRSCPNLIRGNARLCDECEALRAGENKDYDLRRGSSNSRGYDSTWKKVREIKASLNPLCERCLRRGIERPLDVVHHIKPVDKFPELRLVMENLESLCTPCHEEEHGAERWKKPHSRTDK